MWLCPLLALPSLMAVRILALGHAAGSVLH
jgi:hypothetical protein